MFTGIIEEIGIVKELQVSYKVSKIVIEAKKVLEDTKIGDSIATNGVCLTVTDIKSNTFSAEIMGETFRRSNLGKLKKGDNVNLERALTLNSRLGGHIVSGHIDGIGEIVGIKEEDISVWISIKTKYEILRYIIEKGSITIDGISLTVAYVDDEIFKVSIIPHTGKETTLLKKVIGDEVNLECDLIGKYVEKLLLNKSEGTKKSSNISEEFLIENGFI